MSELGEVATPRHLLVRPTATLPLAALAHSAMMAVTLAQICKDYRKGGGA